MDTHTLINVTVSTADFLRVKSLLLGPMWRDRDEGFDHENAFDDGSVEFMQSHQKDGGSETAERLMDARIPFVLHHGSSSLFNEGLIAFDGVRSARATAHNGQTAIVLDEEMRQPSESDLKNARDYLKVRDAAYAIMQDRSRDYIGLAREALEFIRQ